MREEFQFESLSVYKKAIEFAKTVYDSTLNFPKEERYGLTDQFRRAAVSVSLNIAEGHGGSKVEFKRYLKIAKGSVRECIAIITIGKMQKYIDSESEGALRSKCMELSKMIAGLIRSMND